MVKLRILSMISFPLFTSTTSLSHTGNMNNASSGNGGTTFADAADRVTDVESAGIAVDDASSMDPLRSASPTIPRTNLHDSSSKSTRPSMVITREKSRIDPDPRVEAVRFLAQLRSGEDSLVYHVKRMLKKDRLAVRDVFLATVDEWTPLHACTLRGAQRLVKMALKVGVPVDLEMGLPKDLPGRCTPLHLAAHRGNAGMVKLLLHAKASVNKLDATDRTPLHYAVTNGNVLAARKLIKHGADVSDLSVTEKVFYGREIRNRRSASCLSFLSVRNR